MHTTIRTTTCVLAAVLFTTGFASALDRLSPREGSVQDAFDDLLERSVDTVAVNNDAVADTVTPAKPHNFNVKGINDAVLGRDGSKAKSRALLQVGALVLKCSARDDDLLIANTGSIDLPAGTRLLWKVKASGDNGVAKLAHGLDAGEKTKLADVLDGEVAGGTSCSAKVTGL